MPCSLVLCAHYLTGVPVQAYPWCPDALAIFNAIAREEGAPGEQELLACPSMVDRPGQPGPALRTRSAMQR